LHNGIPLQDHLFRAKEFVPPTFPYFPLPVTLHEMFPPLFKKYQHILENSLSTCPTMVLPALIIITTCWSWVSWFTRRSFSLTEPISPWILRNPSQFSLSQAGSCWMHDHYFYTLAINHLLSTMHM